jgi:hypothetical protein
MVKVTIFSGANMRIVTAFLLLVLFASAAPAQDAELSGYAFGGAGAATSTFSRSSTALFHVGGGAEFTARNGLGAGAEFGYLGPWSNGSNGVGLLSLNGLYRFAREQRTQPFVTGGYSLGFRSQTAHFGNIGAGLTTWLSPGTGLRLEFRDNIRDPANHWLTFRFGVAFR